MEKEKRKTLKEIVYSKPFKVKELVYIVVIILLLIVNLVTIYNSQTIQQRCVDHYSNELEKLGYYGYEPMYINIDEIQEKDWGLNENE